MRFSLSLSLPDVSPKAGVYIILAFVLGGFLFWPRAQ